MDIKIIMKYYFMVEFLPILIYIYPFYIYLIVAVAYFNSRLKNSQQKHIACFLGPPQTIRLEKKTPMFKNSITSTMVRSDFNPFSLLFLVSINSSCLWCLLSNSEEKKKHFISYSYELFHNIAFHIWLLSECDVVII